MKKIYLILPLFLVSAFAFAQNLTDALRYSVEELNGTARYKAMSGAFGALGGDFSAIGLNPAGSAVFSGSEIGFSFGDSSQKNKTTYFGTKSDNKSSDFNLGQFGVVLNIPNYQNSNWKKFSIAFNYQQTKNFEINNLNFQGVSSGANLGDYFTHYATGIQQQNLMLEEYNSQKQISGRISLQDLYDAYGSARLHNPYNLRNALLGYTVGMTVPKSGKTSINPSMSDAEATAVLEETTYVKNISNNAVTRQNFERITQGGVRKYNFNFATQYGDNLYMGININSHYVDYKEITKHQEVYQNNILSDITSAYFENELRTTGSGISFQLGVIGKVVDNVRLGVAYTSPTWYSLYDERAQYLRTRTLNNGSFYANPQIVAVYPKYKFRTPSSWTGSIAYIFGKNAILSLDYIYKGYGNTYFSTDYLKAENDIIQNELGDTSSIRLGGEYRIPLGGKGQNLSLRAGYRYEQSPYKNTKFIGNLNGYSFGLGYGFSGIRIDVSHDFYQQKNMYQMYESVLTTPAQVDVTRSNLLFTISMKL